MHVLLPAVVAVITAAATVALAAGAATVPATQPASPLAYTMNDIDGKPVDLSTYKGKVVLIVNVASKCGNTPQYTALEQLYTTYKDKGFTILGFPANNFKAQEPGTNAEIKTFCTEKYGVTFPIFSKISVKGPDTASLYKTLTATDTSPQPKGDITWNFEKFLIGRDGKVVARFAPKTKPSDEQVVKAIEAELQKP